MEPYISPQEFREHYEKLPQELQDAIFSEITAQKIEVIANNHNAGRLVSEIARLTGRVMLGILPLNHFIQALSEHIGVDQQTATSIAQDINRYIFFPVRDALRLIYGIDSLTEPTQKQQLSKQSAFPGAKSPDQIIPQRKGEITFDTQKTTRESSIAPAKPQPQSQRQTPFSISKEEVEEIRPTFREEIKSPPQESQAPHNLPITEKVPQQNDPYKEALAEDDVKTKFSTPGTQNEQRPRPRIDGNIIDLKSINTD